MNNKYQYGYIPKINYWKAQWNQAIENGNVEAAIRAERKVEYFTQRQKEVYGSIAGVNFTPSLELLEGLHI